MICAASNGHIEIVRMLLERGADRDANDNVCFRVEVFFFLKRVGEFLYLAVAQKVF